MMSRSTASFIAYDVRPAKQIERRAMVEFLNCAKRAGFDISSYRYVGFGGTKFVDFQLMHRYVGLGSYVSVEHDEEIYDRCVFNKPFETIQMYCGEFSDFLVGDTYEGNSVYWMDLEGALSNDILADVNSVAEHAVDGDVLFVTISAELPSGTRARGNSERKDILKSRLPSIKSKIDRFKQPQFSEKGFRRTAGLLLLEILKSGFATRSTEGRFHPFLKVIYNDSAWMCTVGGVFCVPQSRRAGKLKRALQLHLFSMCDEKAKNFYEIPQFNFTELERILIDKSEISKGKGYARRLLNLGLDQNIIDEYHRISRFVPKYIESAF